MLQIGDLKIGGNNPCFIVAEIGQNHQGDVNIAKEMIRKAKECGVSCVKLQKTSLPDRFTRSALETKYTGANSFGKTYGEHRAHLEFSEDEFKMLMSFAEKEVNIMCTSSCMDIPSANFLRDINVPFMKIGSGDTNNPFLIEHVAKMNVPIVLSTGMSNLDTVKTAYDIIKQYHSNFALLHCVSAYPTEPKDVNLAVLELYKSQFPDVPIGYSGHEFGITIAVAAVARGAKIIEKHFTLDKAMKGTDHRCSLDPTEMKQLVEGIREVEAAIGLPYKRFLSSEMPCCVKLGKTIVAAREINKGECITISDIAIKVCMPPGRHPREIDIILSSVAIAKIETDTPITFQNVA